MFGQDLSDANLFRRVRRGDTRSFGVLIHRHDTTLRRLASRLLAEPDQVDPVLQKAYTKIWRTAAMARLGSGRDAVRNWLYRVAYNTCVDELRRQPPHSGPPPFTGPRVRLPNTSVERRLSALRALSPNERIHLVLVDSEGFDVRAAARILQRKPSEVATDLAAARHHWRDLVIGPPDVAKADASKAQEPQGKETSQPDNAGTETGAEATAEPAITDGAEREPSSPPDESEKTREREPVAAGAESGNGARPSAPTKRAPAPVLHALDGAFDAGRFTRLKRWFKAKGADDEGSGSPDTDDAVGEDEPDPEAAKDAAGNGSVTDSPDRADQSQDEEQDKDQDQGQDQPGDTDAQAEPDPGEAPDAADADEKQHASAGKAGETASADQGASS